MIPNNSFEHTSTSFEAFVSDAFHLLQRMLQRFLTLISLTLASSPLYYHEVDATLLRESKRSPKLMKSKSKSVVTFFVKDGKHRWQKPQKMWKCRGLDANVSNKPDILLLTLASSPIHYHEVDATHLRESKRSPKLMKSKLKSVVTFFVKDGKHRWQRPQKMWKCARMNY